MLIILDVQDLKKSCRVPSGLLKQKTNVLEYCHKHDIEIHWEAGIEYFLVYEKVNGDDQKPGSLSLKPQDWDINSNSNRDSDSTTLELSEAQKDVKDTPNHVKSEDDAGAMIVNLTGPRKRNWPKAYEYFFRILLGHKPMLPKGTANAALPLIETIVQVARLCGAIPAVKQYFDGLFFDYVGKHELWLAITNEPLRWLNIGAALESRTVYDEAFVHIVGAWRQESAADVEAAVPEEVFRRLEPSARQLRQKRLALERRLLLTTVEAKLAGSTLAVAQSAPSPSTNAAWYHVLCMWHEWLRVHLRYFDEAEKGLEPEPPSTELCSHHQGCLTVAGFFGLLYQAKDAYLPSEEVVKKWQNRKEDNVVRGALDRIKEVAKDTMEELVASRLQSERKMELPYLTCFEVRDEDRTWTVVKEEQEEDDDVEMDDE